MNNYVSPTKFEVDDELIIEGMTGVARTHGVRIGETLSTIMDNFTRFSSNLVLGFLAVVINVITILVCLLNLMGCAVNSDEALLGRRCRNYTISSCKEVV